jgi:hypothetical protein
MRRVAVESSSVRWLAYDQAKEELEIEYKSGGVYRYLGVPPLVYRRLLVAPSVGKFVNNMIKPHFRMQRLVRPR